MKITICGSIAFFDEMMAVKNDLEKMGHEVKLPPTEIPNEQGEMISIKEYLYSFIVAFFVYGIINTFYLLAAVIRFGHFLSIYERFKQDKKWLA